jgi:uncharacterized protein (TIGR02145 family)
MRLFNRQGWGLLLAAAVGAVFAVGAVAQNSADTALVPFIVNVDATVKAVQGSGGANVRTVSMSVTAGEEKVMRMPLGKLPAVGVTYAVPGRANAPVITHSPGGKITLNLPAQSYKNAEVSLYAVNGRRILRHKASEAANAVLKQNVVAGVYLLAAKGNDGNKITSRLTHRGGVVNIAVVFGGENIQSPVPRLSKKAAEEEESWTVTVSAAGYDSANFSFVPAAGENPTYNITLGAGYGGPAYVTAVAESTSEITLNWAEVTGATVYRVYGSTSLNGTYNVIGTASSNTYTHNSLESGTTYYYQISAFIGGVESARSSPVFTKTIVFYAPPGVSATAAPNERITVEWRCANLISGHDDYGDYYCADGVDGYNVYVCASITGTCDVLETISPSSIRSYKHEGLELGVTYYYKVSAYSNSKGEGILSPVVSATIDSKAIPGTFTDTRDNTQYKTTTIMTVASSQTWMAENLNYETASGSRCYNNDVENCNKYGRLYDWATAMDVDVLFNANLLGVSDVKNQGVCPVGWHLPSRAEWDKLITMVGGADSWKLKSTNGWNYNYNGTDDYHFSALPGGGRDVGGNPVTVGNGAHWWTATEYGSGNAYDLYMHMAYFTEAIYYKGGVASIRCVKDD